MPVNIIDSFQAQGNFPLDTRFVIDDIANVNPFATYPGLVVYSEADDTLYVDQNGTFVEIPTGPSGAGITTLTGTPTPLGEEGVARLAGTEANGSIDRYFFALPGTSLADRTLDDTAGSVLILENTALFLELSFNGAVNFSDDGNPNFTFATITQADYDAAVTAGTLVQGRVYFITNAPEDAQVVPLENGGLGVDASDEAGRETARTNLGIVQAHTRIGLNDASEDESLLRIDILPNTDPTDDVYIQDTQLTITDDASHSRTIVTNQIAFNRNDADLNDTLRQVEFTTNDTGVDVIRFYDDPTDDPREFAGGSTLYEGPTAPGSTTDGTEYPLTQIRFSPDNNVMTLSDGSGDVTREREFTGGTNILERNTITVDNIQLRTNAINLIPPALSDAVTPINMLLPEFIGENDAPTDTTQIRPGQSLLLVNLSGRTDFSIQASPDNPAGTLVQGLNATTADPYQLDNPSASFRMTFFDEATGFLILSSS